MTDIVDLSERRLTYQMERTLAKSEHRCGYCREPWSKHTATSMAEHCMELQRMRAETRREQVIAAIRSVNEAAGHTEFEADAMAREAYEQLVHLGLEKRP